MPEEVPRPADEATLAGVDGAPPATEAADAGVTRAEGADLATRADALDVPTLAVGEETLTDGGGSGESAAAAFPAPGWDRYQPRGFIARGGMGQVWRAFDPRLQRKVALKFLLGEDPARARRFVQEAQAQARVDHEHICKVYEVGEVAGRPFIAMQLVDGQPFDAAARQMNREEVVRATVQVCRAVHEAHRTGLIHRDLKPSNVVVARTPEGAWHPYVMDFGLAREVAAPGLTQVGLVVGTAHYMSPEQARGENARLDRRSDVYSLGATLFALLAGRTPFQGSSSLDVLMKVLEGEPPPLRSLDRTVSEDLEAIVGRCLEKDPDRRYESAKALADDLQRHLDGEPVLARMPGLVERARRKLRKHRALATLGAAALLVSLTLLGLWLQAWRTASRRAELAQRFGQDAQAMEGILAYAHVLPLHDTRPERRVVRERMAAVRAAMADLGPLSAGPGHYALGRAHLALGDAEAARVELQAALDAGHRTPGARHALALALGERYLEERRRLQQVEDPGERERRLADLQRRFRDPALGLLREGGAGETSHVPALLALYEDRHEEALGLLRGILERSPLDLPALTLRARVHTAARDAASNRGDFAGAEERGGVAETAYREALEVGRSDPELLRGLADVLAEGVDLVMFKGGADPEPLYRRALVASDQALVADPENEDAWILRARLHRYLYQVRRTRGKDLAPLREAIRETARRFREALPASPRAWVAEADAHRIDADEAAERGLSPEAAYRRSVEACDRALALDRGLAGVASRKGVILLNLAIGLHEEGRDSEKDLADAEAALRQARAQEPTNPNVDMNLGSVLLFRGAFRAEAGEDAEADLAGAVAEMKAALTRNPEDPYPLAYGAQALALQAEARLRAGQDPQPMLGQALEWASKATRVNPDWPDGHTALARAHLVGARARLLGSAPAREALDAAAAAAERALAVNPRDHDAAGLLVAVAELDPGLLPGVLTRLRGMGAGGEDPPAHVRNLAAARVLLAESGGGEAEAARARALLRPLLAARGGSTDLGLLRIRALRVRARGGDAAAAAEGLEGCRELLDRHPRQAEALALRGSLRRARGEAEAGRSDLDRALRLDRTLRLRFGGDRAALPRR